MIISVIWIFIVTVVLFTALLTNRIWGTKTYRLTETYFVSAQYFFEGRPDRGLRHSVNYSHFRNFHKTHLHCIPHSADLIRNNEIPIGLRFSTFAPILEKERYFFICFSWEEKKPSKKVLFANCSLNSVQRLWWNLSNTNTAAVVLHK